MQSFERVLAHVSTDRLIRTCSDLVGIPSPTGYERAVAEYLEHVFRESGGVVSLQEVEADRPNVLGFWRGDDSGADDLMFNGHMDTSNTGDESYLPGAGYKPQADLRDGYLTGLGVYNMKGALACYVEAMRALQDAGVQLRGSVTIAAVVGEIETSQSPIHSGPQYRGYGAGSHYLATHSAPPSVCIIGEPTDNRIVLANFGTLWVRLSVRGPYAHTAFMEGREESSALRKAHRVLTAIFEWADDWAESSAYGEQRATVNVGSVVAGNPWRVSRTPPQADIYLDVRVSPDMPLTDAKRAIEAFVADANAEDPDLGLGYEIFVSVPGSLVDRTASPVVTLGDAHTSVFGQAPEFTTVLWSSDASVLSRYGITTVNYGPSDGPRGEEGERVSIDTLAATARVYALYAMLLCGVKGEVSA